VASSNIANINNNLLHPCYFSFFETFVMRSLICLGLDLDRFDPLFPSASPDFQTISPYEQVLALCLLSFGVRTLTNTVLALM